MQAVLEPLAPSDEQLDPERVIEVETDVGSLWLERSDEILTPTTLETGRWQPELIELLPRILRPGMTVVDAGANIGFISVHASKLVGPSGRVYCIEVDPANVSILRANLWRNGCTNARVLPVAAWSERTDLNLTVVPEGGAASHVSTGPAQATTVAAHRLDELIDGPVDYLKVDCEGTDHIVLRGAAGLFERNPGLVATVEFVPGHTLHTGDSAAEILLTYREMGLRPYLVSSRGHLRPTRYERLAAMGSEDGLLVIDFALSRLRPIRQILGYFLADAPVEALEPMLRLGGDLLEHVPPRVRPRIRRRDRKGT